MRRRIEPMVVGRIVGDVVDIFKPEVEISIHYGNKQLTNGCHFNPSLTHHHPILQISPFSSSSSHLFTLVMVDPDAPSPSEPTLRELLHWYLLVVFFVCFYMIVGITGWLLTFLKEMMHQKGRR